MSGPWERYAQASAPAADGPWAKYAAAAPAQEVAPTEPAAPVDQRPQPVDWSAIKDRLSNVWGRLSRGLMDPVEGGAQIIEQSIRAKGLDTDAEARKMGMQPLPEAMRQSEQEYRDLFKGQDPGIDPLRIAGNVAATLPLAAMVPTGAGVVPAIASGAAQGGILGALQPVTEGDFWSEKGKQVATGAGLGGLSGGLVDRIAAAISPKVQPQVQQLMDKGVTPTPGQVLGGSAQRIEEGLTSVPFLGDAIKGGQRRAIEQFNIAALDDALAPIGKKLPQVEAGREAVETAGKLISEAYDDLLPKMSAQVDDAFLSDLQGLTATTKLLPPEKANQFANILDDAMTPRLEGGAITGEGLKQIDSRLGSFIRKFSRSQSPDDQLLAEGLQGAKAALRGLVQRTNPEYAGPLRSIDEAYAKFLRLENAASRTGAKEGVFSPAQLNQSVRQMGGKREFARGNALMQDFASDAEKVLGAKVPDSGTPFRLTNLAAIGGAGFIDPSIPVGVAAGSAMYSPTGQQIMARLLASRPEGAQGLSQGVRQLSPLAAALLAQGAN